MRTTTLLSALALVFAVACDRTGDAGGDGTGTGTGSGTATGATGTGSGTAATATGTGTGTGTGSATGTGTGGARDCSTGPSDPDSLWEDQFAELYPRTTDSYSNDSGVLEVLATAKGLADGEEATRLALQVTSAYVTNIGYLPDGAADISFWFGDQDSFMRTYRTVLDNGISPNDLRRGDAVSFEVNALSNYGGELQVTELSDFAITGSDNPVHLIDATDGQLLSYDTHGLANISVYGTITAATGECGGSANCYDLTLTNDQIVTFRVSEIVEIVEGDCIWWVGPVGGFGGMQLDASEFGWFAFY